MNFESATDFVLDVSWNPVNPLLFSSSDSEGNLDIWDISSNIEDPIKHLNIDGKGINKLKWSNDGSKLAAGDSDGNVSLFGLD